MSEQGVDNQDQAADPAGDAGVDATEIAGIDEAMTMADAAARKGIEMLGDVDLDVAIELGRATMLVEDVLRLGSGSVVELDKLAGDPVDVYVNQRLVARGEVLVLNDNFCIRISEIIAELDEETGELTRRQSA